jgi:cytoskeleton protein RodZ
MSIGTQLHAAREAQSLSLEQVAQATHIKLHYLEALEADQFEVLPSAAQLRGFLRTYGEYLKIDTGELVKTLDKGSAAGTVVNQRPNPILAPAPEARAPSTNSEAIFKELGHMLQLQRELMGLTLGDVERHTHIRIHYVKALEQGDIGHLPSPVQGRGMLSNYASFLGLNTETVLLRFADGLQASLYDRQAVRKASPVASQDRANSQMPAKPSRLKRLFSMDLFVGGFLVIFLLGFSIWGALRISKLHSSAAPSPTAPSVSGILLSTSNGEFSSSATPLPGSATVSPVTASLEAPVITATLQVSQSPTQVIVQSSSGLENAPIQVYVVAVQRAWLRITVDGEVAFEGRVIPGSAYSFSGTQQIELLTGDGAGIQVVFNQQDLGILGSFGEVVERIFTLGGIQTATPSVLPTRTPAPTSSITPSLTPTQTGVPATSTPTPKS